MLGHEGLIGWQHSGSFAVQVFFALSGWLIGGILVKADPKDLPRFYFNRALRIWVPYYLALLFLVGASLIMEPLTTKWFEFVFYKLSFVYNIFGTPQLAEFSQAMPLKGTGNHYWSVNAEEQFYLIAPVLLVLTQHRLARNSLVWILIAAISWITDTYTSIVLGVLAAVAVNQYGNLHESVTTKAILTAALLASTYALFIDLNYTKIVPITAISIILLLARHGEKSKIGAIFGGMSYPLYLNHWIGLFAAHAILKPFGMRDSLLAHAVSFVLNILLAIALYLFIDKKILQIRENLFTQSRANLVIAFAYGLVILGCIVGFSIQEQPT